MVSGTRLFRGLLSVYCTLVSDTKLGRGLLLCACAAYSKNSSSGGDPALPRCRISNPSDGNVAAILALLCCICDCCCGCCCCCCGCCCCRPPPMPLPLSTNLVVGGPSRLNATLVRRASLLAARLFLDDGDRWSILTSKPSTTGYRTVRHLKMTNTLSINIPRTQLVIYNTSSWREKSIIGFHDQLTKYLY